MKPSVDTRYWALVAGQPIWTAHLPDPKPLKRVEASADEWVKLRAEKLGPCRLCETTDHPELHHVVPRGMGGATGDDVADNLVSLCRGHHAMVEARDPWARSLLGQRLTDVERAYVVRKKSAAWLEAHYGVKTREAA